VIVRMSEAWVTPGLLVAGAELFVENAAVAGVVGSAAYNATATLGAGYAAFVVAAFR
jgi:hypothetical protein